jgi:uncharacterized membrane protein YvlD (DUF360 family)
MSTLEWGVVALVLAGVFHWLRIFATIRSILGFIGTCIVTTGLFGLVLDKVVIWVAHLTNAVTGKVFGVGIPGLIILVLAIVFIHDLHPKKGASGRTLWVGIALAACLVGGISSWSAVNHIPSDVQNGVGNVKTLGR